IVLAMGEPCLLIGTLGAYLATPNGERTALGGDIDFTTPEVFQIQALLREARNQGTNYAVMEVSSHALDQKRADGIHFSAGVFTNLTQDHLDYHGTMEAYAEAKLRLFTDFAHCTPNGFRSVINLDAEWGAWYAERAKGDLWTYGTSEGARVRAVDVAYRADGIQFRAVSEQGNFEMFTSLRAHYNLYNALGATVCALSLGVPIPAIQQGIAQLTRVPGRFERVPIETPFEVYVDFAHTPDALERVLHTARQLHPTRLTVVFGCGGDRDPLKRPKMGAIAAQLADKVILTSDNPRTEDPMQILHQILEGVPTDERARVIVEPDRQRAIEIALSQAQPGEIVLMAGKGHEEYQIIGTTRYPFSDRQVVLQWRGVKEV
ncbi:MAG: UDP-N-acetylmuramoyl-L-alanyl-D-glutamate--2,6-diaminopimelate ligase, partial [Fimbriimonadales bacterium]